MKKHGPMFHGDGKGKHFGLFHGGPGGPGGPGKGKHPGLFHGKHGGPPKGSADHARDNYLSALGDVDLPELADIQPIQPAASAVLDKSMSAFETGAIIVGVLAGLYVVSQLLPRR